MPNSHILDALDTLSKAVDTFETALNKAEARVKSSNGKKPKTNQIDLFEILSAAPAPANSVDVQDVSERLGRVIAQIEDVLQAA